MNCDQLGQLTGWDCYPVGERAIRAVSPFTLGEDGDHAAFYFAQTGDNSFLITDAGETAMHAASLGVHLTKARLDTLNNTYGVRHARLERDGVITARGSLEDAQSALWDSVKLAMSLTFNSGKWLPKLDQLRFRAMVEKLLYETIEEKRIAKNMRVKGMSGHIVEFPFAVQTKRGYVYIEPVGLSNEKVDWGHIYQLHGKLSDVKQAEDQNERLVIFEDNAPQPDFGRAVTLLSQASNIITFTDAWGWAKAA